MSGWTQPIPAAHWQRSRESQSFDSLSYLDPVPPIEVVFRAPMKAPRFAPYRMPQRWIQPPSLSITQTSIQFRAPMQAPTFWNQYLGWRQAWNPINLQPQQAVNLPTVRYHVIGSPVVRRFK